MRLYRALLSWISKKLQRWTLHNHKTCSNSYTSISFSLEAGKISLATACDYCLFSFCCAPLRKVSFPFLYNPPSARWRVTLLISRLNKLSCPTLPSSNTPSSQPPSCLCSASCPYVLGSPKLNTVLQIRSCKCQIEEEAFFHWPAWLPCSVIPDTRDLCPISVGNKYQGLEKKINCFQLLNMFS